MSHQAFFSYACDDRDNYLERFFDELREEVRTRAAILKNEIGRAVFRDTTDIKHGTQWENVLGEALRTSQCLVAICSPLYFVREFCGKEWGYFEQRLLEQGNPGAATIPRIFPILWNPLPGKTKPPAVVAKYQNTQDGYGADYAQLGLRSLIKRDDPQARQIIEKLAKSIVDTATEHPLAHAANKPVFSSLPNPFGRDMAAAPVRQGSPRGPRCVQFVYVAGLRDQFRDAEIERPDEVYGEDADSEFEWRPFYPPAETKAHRLASRAASECDLLPERLPISHELDERIRDAERNNKIVILLVDPWTLKIAFYRDVLSRYDERRFMNTAIVVPWNESDPMLREEGENLLKLLEETFSRQETPPDQFSVSSEEKLTEQIKSALQQCRARIVKKQRVMQKPVGPGMARLPLVTGPAGKN